MQEGQVEQQLVEQHPAATEQQPENVAATEQRETQQQAVTEGNEEAGTEQQQRDEQGRFKPKVQQRIDEITRARHEAEREAAYWRARAEATGSGKEKDEDNNQPSAKPSQDQFGDYAEYVEALADWKAEQKVNAALAARDAEKAREAESKVKQTRAQAWEERQTAAKATIPDYDEVVGLSDIQIAPHVVETLLDSDQGPALAYHLAKNPDVAERISALSPLAAAREIGRLEASLSKPVAAQQAKPVSKAPEPIKPIGAGNTNSGDPKTMPMDQYMEMRRKQGARWAR